MFKENIIFSTINPPQLTIQYFPITHVFLLWKHKFGTNQLIDANSSIRNNIDANILLSSITNGY